MISHMPNYCRAFVPGGCFFFAVNLLERRQTLLVDHIAALRAAVARTRQNHPFTIDAFVVLPDHLHAVWALPPGDSDFSTRWRLVKSRFHRGTRAPAAALRFTALLPASCVTAATPQARCGQPANPRSRNLR
jgi:REP element-mobilizing transposase RayT